MGTLHCIIGPNVVSRQRHIKLWMTCKTGRGKLCLKIVKLALNLVLFIIFNLLFYVPPIVCGGSGFWSLYLYALICVVSSFASILTRMRELVALL